MQPFVIETIEKNFFKRGNPIKKLLKISLDLFDARHTGILYGTNQTKIKFLPTSMWDRGIMDKFDGRGVRGFVLKMFGTHIVTARNLSPVYFFKTGPAGERTDNDGIISYVLRNFTDYYRKGIRVIICPDTDKHLQTADQKYYKIPFFSYDGNLLEKPEQGIKVDTRIVRHFHSSNSIYIYLPDYGILVINTADTALLETGGDGFVREKELLGRLDILIKLVESSSLAYLGQLTGKKGARLLWRKEQHLRKTSQELIENEKNYRDLYENAPIAYITMDPEGRILKCNQKAEILSGYTRDELVNQRAAPLFLESASLGSHIADIGNRLVNDDGVKDMELQMRPKNGVPLWVSVSVDAGRDKTGKIVELRAMVMDISGRKSLEKQLFQAQKMEAVGTLAGGIAHDFNNILSPISGYTEMMLMDMGQEDSNKEFLTIVMECVNHAKKLVNQILTFSRQQEHELTPLNPGDAVRESMALITSFLPATIRVNLTIDPDCGHIQADPVQIHQVIMNLMTNAFHAMEESGGVLDISLGQEKNMERIFPETAGLGKSFIRLSVKDTGTGIDPAILEKIFDPYFSTKKEGKGSGIGLSVVHGVVESHNGYIRVKANKDKGTCFDLYFPVCRKRLVIPPEKRQDHSIKTGNESILLVDDDVKVGIMETHMLQKLGYAVTCFNCSLAAKTAFERNPARFDAVITDMTMPDLTGVQLANELQAIRPDVPVILCTGFGDTIKKNNSDLPFIRGFLKKPVGIRDLSHLVRQVLEEPTGPNLESELESGLKGSLRGGLILGKPDSIHG